MTFEEDETGEPYAKARDEKVLEQAKKHGEHNIQHVIGLQGFLVIQNTHFLFLEYKILFLYEESCDHP